MFSTNTEILNAVREVSSPIYQNSIPVSNSPQDYEQIFNALMSDEIGTPIMNEFLGKLLNKVLVQRVYDTATWRHPFEMFVKDGSSFGDTEELITLDTGDGEDYTEESSLLRVTKPKTFVSYIYTTSRKRYPISFNENVLRGAFLKEYGIANMLSVLMKRIQLKSNQLIYNQTRDDFKKIANEASVGVIGSVTPEADAKAVYTNIIALVENMFIPSKRYNIKGIDMNTAKGSAYLFLNANYKASFDVYVLASLFNSQNIGENKYFKEIRVIEIDEDNVIGYVVDTDGYLIVPRIRFAGSFFDASNMVTNYWEHIWLKQGLNPFAQSLKLVKENSVGNIQKSTNTLPSGASFTISADNNVAYGTTVTVTATVPSGYTLVNVNVTTLDGIGIAVELNGNTATFTMPNRSVEVGCVFARNNG